MDHIRNEHDTIENTDHFCGFLLQMRREGERKDRLQLEFNTKTLAERQIGDDIASIGKLRATASPDLRMESIRVVEETGLKVFR
jgi:hypothetical protein